MGVFLFRHHGFIVHVPDTIPRHSSHALSTAHAIRTHVKAPQTDLHGKPDNSSGPPTTARQKGFYARKRRSSIKKHRKAWRTPSCERLSKPRTDQLSSMLHPIRNRDQGPKGNTETKTSSLSLPKAMEGASKTLGQTPWLLSVGLPTPSRPDTDRSRLPIHGDGIGLASDSERAPRGSRLTLLPNRVSTNSIPLEYGD